MFFGALKHFKQEEVNTNFGNKSTQGAIFQHTKSTPVGLLYPEKTDGYWQWGAFIDTKKEKKTRVCVD